MLNAEGEVIPTVTLAYNPLDQSFLWDPVDDVQCTECDCSYVIELDDGSSFIVAGAEQVIGIDTNSYTVCQVTAAELPEQPQLYLPYPVELEVHHPEQIMRWMDTGSAALASGRRKFVIKPQIPLDQATGHLMGMHVGDGWADNAVHISKKSLSVQRVWHQSMGGLVLPTDMADSDAPTLQQRKREKADIGSFGSTEKLTISSVSLATFFSSLIPSGARKKHLPEVTMFTSHDFRAGILAGLLDTDGCFSINKSAQRNKPQLIVKYDTTSLRLALEMVVLSNSLGVSASISDAKTPKGLLSYILYFNVADILAMGVLHRMHNAERKAVYDEFLTMPGSVLPEKTEDKIPISEALAREIRSRLPGGSQATNYSAWSEAVRRGYIRRDHAQAIISVVAEPLQNSEHWQAFTRLASNESLHWKRIKQVTRLPGKTTAVNLQLDGGLAYYAFDRPLMPSIDSDTTAFI